MAIFPGRHSGQIEGDFVVFLIGMRINKPWKVREWLPVFTAMPKMLRELEQVPDSGLLAHTMSLAPSGPFVVQYWRSFEQLERYARNPEQLHLPAWKRFNQRIRASGDVGIWHETYRVRAGEYESIYGNMPRIGLASAGTHVAIGTTGTAATRSGVRADDRAPIAY
jgi:hypothetical protein